MRLVREACLHLQLHRLPSLLPADGRRLEEVYIKSVRRYGVDVLRERAQQTGSLPFAARVLMRRLLLCSFHDRVITKSDATILIGHTDVVDRLLDLCRITFVVRIE